MSTFVRSLPSTWREPNANLEPGNVAQSGIPYAAARTRTAEQPRIFIDFAFFQNKIRCLVRDPHADDVARAIAINDRWDQQQQAAAAAAGDGAAAAENEENSNQQLQEEEGGGKIVRVVFSLNIDQCPRTSQNFISLCTDGGLCQADPRGDGIARDSATAGRIKTSAAYKGTYLHKLIPGFVVAGGDVTSSSGLNNAKSALQTGGWFRDESLAIPHDRKGLLSMCNSGANSCGSMFFITLGEGESEQKRLDARHCCFGEAVEGFAEFEAECKKCLISGAAVLASCVVIKDCGVL